jgi:23S rRNA pseudouridine1911/1915/1917 synthase
METRGTHAANYSPSAPASRRARVPEAVAGQRLDLILAQLFPEVSRSRLQAWVRAGKVKVNGALVDLRHKLWGGETIELDDTADVAASTDGAEDIGLSIIHEDAHLIVVDKPVGLVVHPGNGNRSGTLQNALLHHAPALQELPRAGIVHRLDKDTSGLLVVAKTLVAHTDLVRQLQARTVKRHYLALVHGIVAKDGKVDAPIGRHPVQRTRMAINPHGREARTWYAVERPLGAFTLIECRLDTGRTHQIRVHMASIKHPLVGDATYGKRRSGNAIVDAFPRQALHARRLGLVHPATGDPCQWDSPLPADFEQLLDALSAPAR